MKTPWLIGLLDTHAVPIEIWKTPPPAKSQRRVYTFQQDDNNNWNSLILDATK